MKGHQKPKVHPQRVDVREKVFIVERHLCGEQGDKDINYVLTEISQVKGNKRRNQELQPESRRERRILRF